MTVFLEDQQGERHVRDLRAGDLGYVPAGIVHVYRVEVDETRVLGVSCGGFERFFATLGEPITADRYPSSPLGLLPPERFAEAGRRFGTRFHLDLRLDT